MPAFSVAGLGFKGSSFRGSDSWNEKWIWIVLCSLLLDIRSMPYMLPISEIDEVGEGHTDNRSFGVCLNFFLLNNPNRIRLGPSRSIMEASGTLFTKDSLPPLSNPWT